MELLLVTFTALTTIRAVTTDPTQSKSKLVLEIIMSTNLPGLLFQSQLLHIVPYFSLPQVLTPATTIPLWMSLGDQSAILITMECVTIMLSGMAGTGYTSEVKMLRCQSHVLTNTCVALKSHFGSTALIHSWKMEWSPVRSVFPHGRAAVVTHPTLFKSKPVQEITMFMSLSGQCFVEFIA
ncbi:hypothetical protein PO909_000897, partial [Leuciscus waleckii]